MVSLNPKNDGKILGFPAIIQKSVVTNVLKTVRKHMHHKTTNEFHAGDGNHFLLLAFVIFGAKSNVFFINGKDSGIGDGNAIGIAAEIFNGISVSVEGLFNLGIPINGIKLVFEFIPDIMVSKFLA